MGEDEIYYAIIESLLSTIIKRPVTCTKSSVGVIILVRIELVVVLIKLAVKVPRLAINTTVESTSRLIKKDQMSSAVSTYRHVSVILH